MKENIKKTVSLRDYMLRTCNKDFEGLFNIIFSDKEKIACEYLSNYKIVKITYSELEKKINDFAYSFNKLYPEINKSIVGIYFKTNVDWLVSFWGILKSGNIPFLINLKQTIFLINENLKLLNCEYYISDSNKNINAKFIDFNCLNLKNSEDFTYNFENSIVLSSSGTMLKPKACFYSGENIINQISNYRKLYKENPFFKMHYKGNLKLLAFIPFYHIFGLVASYFWYAVFSRTVVFLNNLSSECIISTIQKCEVTHIFAVPLFFETIEKEINKNIKNQPEKLQKKFQKGLKISKNLQIINPKLGLKQAKKLFKQINEKVFGPSVVMLISGGSFIKKSTLELFNLLGYPLFNGYGLTEAGIGSVNCSFKFKERVDNSIGFPMELYSYEIDENSELIIKSNCGSYMIKEENNEVKTNGIYKTSDIVEKKNGKYYVLGRKNDLVITSSGENINPNLIENNLKIDNVIDYCVLDLEENTNDILCLVVQISKLTYTKYIEKILDVIDKYNSQVSFDYQIKKIYFTFDDIKTSGAIKVSRKYLKENIKNKNIEIFEPFIIKEDADFDKVINESILNKVKYIIANELGMDVNDLKDDSNIIFDLNANSIDYMSIVNEINKTFEIDFKFEEDSCKYTPLELAKKVSKIL